MTSITHPELVKSLVKPGDAIAAEMTASEADLWHAATGVAGEAGEILEASVAACFSGHLDHENMVEELGDMEFYLEQTRQNLGLDRTAILLAADGIEFSVSRDLFEATAILCVGGSALLDAAKKVAIYKKPADEAVFVTALGKIECAMENIRVLLGVDREATLAGNIAKLSKRYASGSFSNEQAQARADKEEGQ